MPPKGTVRDPETGKFVRKEASTDELVRLRAELAALKGEEPIEAPVEEIKPLETLRLQSKYTTHTVSIIPTTRRVHATLGIVEPVPGLFAQFTGPQRIFDSVAEQKKWGWTDEQREVIEKRLVERDEYMVDYFPAPLSPVPDRLKPFTRVKEAPKTKICMAFGYVEGSLVQCGKPATAGRDFCQEHDPDVTRISKGGTTVG